MDSKGAMETTQRQGRIELDRSRLLGFDQVDADALEGTQLAKVGDKPLRGSAAPTRIGGKIGGKIGAKPAEPSRFGTRIGGKIGFKQTDRAR